MFSDDRANTPDETNVVTSAVSCYKEADQLSVSFVMSLFASFDEICGMAMWNGNEFCTFNLQVTLTKIVNTVHIHH